MTDVKPTAMDAIEGRQRERLSIAVTTFIIFFQACVVAPIIPALSNVFRTSVETVGTIVPAYFIPMESRPSPAPFSPIGWVSIA